MHGSLAQSAPARGQNTSIPVYNLSVDLNIDVKNAMELPSDRKLEIIRENGSARLDIPESRIHTIICLETP